MTTAVDAVPPIVPIVPIDSDGADGADGAVPPRSRADYLAHARLYALAIDATGEVCWVSPQIARVEHEFGFQFLGQRMVDFVHDDDREILDRMMERCRASDGPQPEIQVRLKESIDDWQWLSCRVTGALGDPELGAIILTLQGFDEQYQMRSALEERDQYLGAMLQHLPIALVGFDRHKRITFAEGTSWHHPLGSPGDLIGHCVDELPFDEVAARFDTVLAGNEIHYSVRPPSDERVIEINCSPMLENGHVVGGLVIIFDVTQSALSIERLARSERRFRALALRSSDVAMILDADAVASYASPSVRSFGYEEQHLIGASLFDLCHPDDAAELREGFAELIGQPGASLVSEMRVRDRYGRYRWVEQMLTNDLDDAAVCGIVANIRDLSERKRAEQRFSRMTLTDGLTGLPNRTEFTERLRESVVRAERQGERVTVVFLDLDQFKVVNDGLGHNTGDELLREVAYRLRATVRDEDLVARFGGDEFVVLIEGGDDVVALQVAERLAASFDEPFEMRGESVFVGASIGVASTPPFDADAILRHADVATNRAKALGRNRIELFDSTLGDEATTVFQLRNELRRAIELQQFVLHYQPIVDLERSKVVGMEALVRWQHPERGMVPPLDFIPAAEDTGIIVELGKWVLMEACATAALWPDGTHVAVNLSARQLVDHRIVGVVAAALERSGLEAHRLVLEVTESAVMTNAEVALACLTELKKLGVHLSIDDFGTGYSSLVYLKRMPVDAIKIDRSFVDGLGTDPEDTAIVSSVISLAHAVGLSVVAEGVETDAQKWQLVGRGCDLAQGYLWSRPVPADQLSALFTAQV